MTSTKHAKEIMRQAMIIPQPVPYIIGTTVKRPVKRSARRKVSDTERGLIEARSFIGGKERI